jgi:hypothetical protein
VPTQTQRTRVQRLSPKNKEVSPYIPLQAGYRSKRAACDTIGYFISPVLFDLHVSIF